MGQKKPSPVGSLSYTHLICWIGFVWASTLGIEVHQFTVRQAALFVGEHALHALRHVDVSVEVRHPWTLVGNLYDNPIGALQLAVNVILVPAPACHDEPRAHWIGAAHD